MKDFHRSRCPTSRKAKPARRRGPRVPAFRFLTVCGAALVAQPLVAQPEPLPRLTPVVDARIADEPNAAFSVNYITNVRPWQGGFVMNNAMGASHVLFVAREGQPVQHIDRYGDGPGEFRSVHHLGSFGDSLLVYSPGVVTVLGPQLRYGRQFPVSGLVFTLAGNTSGVLFTGEAASPRGANVWFTDRQGSTQFVLDEALESPPGDIAPGNFRAAALVGDTILLASRDAKRLTAFSSGGGAELFSVPIPAAADDAHPVDMIAEGGTCFLLSTVNRVDLPTGETFEMRKVRDSRIVKFECRTGRLLGYYEGPEGFTGLLPGLRAYEMRLREETGELFAVIYSFVGG